MDREEDENEMISDVEDFWNENFTEDGSQKKMLDDEEEEEMIIDDSIENKNG